MHDVAFRGMNIERYPLSNSQMNIWNLEKSNQGTSINVICESIHIRGTFDVALIQKSLNLILHSDGSLRTQITLDEHEPMQYEEPFLEKQFPVYDFTTTSETNIRYWEEVITREVMTLYDSPLCQFSILKLGEHEGSLLIKTHHIISDGWSQVLLINRIASTYLALVNGEEAQLTASPSYRLHVEEEERYLASDVYKRDSAYWTQGMSLSAQPASLKTFSGAFISPVGRRKSFVFPQILSQSIISFCNQYRVAPFAVYYMALAIYLKRIGGAERFRIGVPIFNRINATERETSGMFVSTLPFTGSVDENWSLSDFVENLTENWYDMLRHQRFPLSQIMQMMRGSHPTTLDEPAFNIALSFQGSRIYCNQNTEIEFSGQWLYSGYQSEQLCIHLSNMENERRFTVNYDYLTQLFSETEIEEFHSYISTILSEALANPRKPIWQLPVISTDEQEKILFGFNRFEAVCRDGSIAERFRDVANRHPDKVAVIHRGARTCYKTLREKADDISHALSGKVANEQGVVAILLPKSVEMVAAMVGIAQAGHAWMILSTQWPYKRIEEILADSGACALISTKECIGETEVGIPVLDAHSLPHRDELYPLVKTKPTDLAYVVYTSGSTGKPKGVEIEQGSLANFASAIAHLYSHDAVLSVFSASFDAFLVDSICALLNSRTIVLPEEEDIESGAKLASLIRRYAVGFINMSPSRLATFCRDRSFLSSLNRMESIVCGGEHFPSELLTLLKHRTKARIYNIYGPTETTIGVSCRQLNDAARISIGAPLPGCRLYVLDEHRQPLPIGVYGELYIGGICVGRGYRNDQQLTDKVYFDNPFEYGERIYKSGDTACWTPEGEILLRGRKDEQVKLRGLRIEPQEIAAKIAQHQAVESSFVRVVEIGEAQTLVAYYTSKKPIPEYELLAFAATYLPTYMIPSCFIHLERVPMTQNGKIDFDLLPKPISQQSDKPASSVMQQRIVDIFKQVLGSNEISAASDYFISGGNSLNALETLALMEETFGQRLRAADLWACRNAIRLEQLLLGGQSVQPIENIKPAPVMPDYPLSSTQQSIYVQCVADPTGLAYNMPGALRINGKLDEHTLENALKSMISALTILRTSFHMLDKGLVQEISENVAFELLKIQASSMDEAASQFVQPFDLAQAPLFRAALWQESKDTDVLFIDMHHIISDGLSTPMLLNHLNARYNGNQPTVSKIDYKDYAYWNATEHAELSAQARSYWEQTLQGLESPLDLPLDHSRPKLFDFSGDAVMLAIPADLQTKLDAAAKQQQITPYTLFMAAFGILLQKLSGSEDFVVGTPVSGRYLPDTMQVIGSFIQTLPLRLKPKANLSLSEYLQEVKESVVGLLDNQQIPIEEIISLLSIGRELGRSTLYNTMVTMRPVDDGIFHLGEQPAETIPLSTHTSKLDLSLEVFIRKGNYGLSFEFATSLFNRETIELYSRSYLKILTALVEEQEQKISQIDAVDVRDQIALFENQHHLYTPFVDLPIDMRIEQKARLMPHAPAMVFRGKTVTYEELMARARHIAGRLIISGAKKGDIIGLSMQRGVDMIAAMIGIMQLGCAYMPLLASFPHNRLCAITQIAGASLVICDEATNPELPANWPCKTVAVEGETSPFVAVENRRTDDLMHVLFTSGSTGQPKGVMLTHHAIANLLCTLMPLMNSTEGNVLCTTNVIFDTFFAETLLTLCCGRCIVIADEEEMLLPWRIAQLIERESVRVMQLTPSRLQMCLGNNAFVQAVSKLSMMLLAGEALSVVLKDRLCSLGDLSVINLYGPTEAAVYALAADVTDCKDMIIGKPLRNCRAYVLDEQLHPVMPTARGELYLAGECLAKGYIGQQQMTDAAFVPDPWFPNQKMYRTGDVVRMLADGNYVFIGRKDSQIKLNGQRVELQEISEKAISTKLVKEAAALAYSVSGGLALRLYAVVDADATVSETDLIEQLKKELPDYMIPTEVVFINEMPRTASGKTNLRALQTYVREQTALQNFQTDDSQQMSAASEAEAVYPEDVGGSTAETTMSKPCEETELEYREIPSTATEAPMDASMQPQTDVANEPEPARPTNDEPFKATGKPTSEQMVSLWRQVLSRDSVDMSLSFFKQGGTSLGALHLLSLYFNRGLTMTMVQFYDNPTLLQQIALLDIKTEQTALQEEADSFADQFANDAVAPASRTQMEQALLLQGTDGQDQSTHLTEEASHKQIYDGQVIARQQKAQEQDAVLLTGATGFLGAHLLKELLGKGTKAVVCTVRNGDAGRLWDALIYYFGQTWFKENFRRITAVSGDVRLPNLGIDIQYHTKTLSRVGCIVHAAADVRHYAQDDGHFKTNYEGTKHVIELARAWDVKLCHISTISVSGEYLVNNPQQDVQYDETCRDVGQNWRENIYVKTKFMAENLVFAAMDSGLDAKIFRIGRLVGRSEDGVFQPNPAGNTFYNIVVALRQMEQIPDSLANLKIEMTAVDECARAVVTLLNGKNSVYHVYNPHLLTLHALMRELGNHATEVDEAKFRRYIMAKLNTGSFDELSPLIDMYNRLIKQKATIHPKCDATLEELASQRFDWQKLNVSLLLKAFSSRLESSEKVVIE